MLIVLTGFINRILNHIACSLLNVNVCNQPKLDNDFYQIRPSLQDSFPHTANRQSHDVGHGHTIYKPGHVVLLEERVPYLDRSVISPELNTVKAGFFTLKIRGTTNHMLI